MGFDVRYDYDQSENDSESVFDGDVKRDEMKENWCKKYGPSPQDAVENKMTDDVKGPKSDDQLKQPEDNTVILAEDENDKGLNANQDSLEKDKCSAADKAQDDEDNITDEPTCIKSEISQDEKQSISPVSSNARQMDDTEMKNIFALIDTAYEKINPGKRKEAASSPDKELLQGSKVARVTNT